MQQQHATMTATVALWLTALSIVFAASAAADGPLEGEDSAAQHATTDNPNNEAAVDNLPRPGEQAPPTANDVPTLWPWLESEAGHDKCKRKKQWRPLPLWCFGVSSWPVLKAQAVTATVVGIRDPGTAHPTNKRN
jgi:hypothetical protein